MGVGLRLEGEGRDRKVEAGLRYGVGIRLG